MVIALLFLRWRLFELLGILIPVLLSGSRATRSLALLSRQVARLTLHKTNRILLLLWWLDQLAGFPLVVGGILKRGCARFSQGLLFSSGILCLFKLLLLLPHESESSGVLGDDLRGESLMGLEASLLNRPHPLVLVRPLALHLVLEVFADFKVGDLLFKDFLNENLVNILEVNAVCLALIRLDLIGLQDLQDVLLFNDNLLLIVHIERVLVVDLSLFSSECLLCFEGALLVELFAAEWLGQVND